MADSPTLPALVAGLPEPDPPSTGPTGLSLCREIFLLDELMLPVHPGVAAGPHDGVGRGVRSPGQGGRAGVGRGQRGRARHPLYHRHSAHAGSYSIPSVFPGEKNIIKTLGPNISNSYQAVTASS